MKNKRLIPVSIIMPMRNASTTIVEALRSLERQTYPIREIIIIDNASTDDSVEQARVYAQTSRHTIVVTRRRNNTGVGTSFNYGVKRARSAIVILMHSDCSLATRYELSKLVAPFDHKHTVASYPTIQLDRMAWNNYSFWQKAFFSRELDHPTRGLTTKFDAISREVYLQIGGFDMVNFGVGGEDADLHERLKKEGIVALSDARVIHYHFLGGGYSMGRLLAKQRAYARIYGRLMRMRIHTLWGRGIVLFLKPVLAILPFFPQTRAYGMVLLVLYSFLYTKRMFTTRSTLHDPRIIMLPLFNIFLVYYETFWIVEAFLFGKHKIE